MISGSFFHHFFVSNNDICVLPVDLPRKSSGLGKVRGKCMGPAPKKLRIGEGQGKMHATCPEKAPDWGRSKGKACDLPRKSLGLGKVGGTNRGRSKGKGRKKEKSLEEKRYGRKIIAKKWLSSRIILW